MPDRPAGDVLVLAPTGRDAEGAALLLRREGVGARILRDCAALPAALDAPAEDIGAVLVAVEALAGVDLTALAGRLRRQPAWSDLPFVVLTSVASAARRGLVEARLGEVLGNLIYVERPASAVTLVGAVRSALRARSRQLLLRDRLAERDRAAAALAESEGRYHALFENMDAGFCVIEVKPEDAEGRVDYRVVEANPAFWSQSGWDTGIMGRWLREAAPALEEHWYEIYGRIARTGEPERFEQGSALLGRWFDLNAFRVGAPSARRVAVLFTNVSPRRQAEVRLKESEARYRTLFEAIDAGFFILEVAFDEKDRPRDMRFLEVNPAFERQSGIVGAKGRWASEAVPGLEPAWLETYGRIATEGGSHRFEREEKTLGRWFDVHAFRTGEPGERRVAVLFADVTERRRIEREIRELNDTLERRVVEAVAQGKVFADIVESSDSFVQVLDPDFRWLAINKASADEFERVFGARPTVGGSLLDALAEQPGERQAARALWSRALAGEEFTAVSEFGDPARDRRCYELKFNTLRDKDGRLIGAYQFVTDVTERREQEARLASTEEALRQSQKMEAVGQLTGGIAHDFNNLLAGIMAAVDMTRRRIGQGRIAETQPLLDAATQSAQRAASLIQRLLAFSRRQPLDPRPVDIAVLVRGMEDLLRRTLGPEHSLELELAAGLWPTLCDPVQLESAILNLCINARDAMPGGGRLTVGAENLTGEPQGVVDRVRIFVDDTGAGMAPETVARAFEPFFTTKPLGQGTGLGLSMVYGFVTQSGGEISIDSQEGKGTTIRLELPRHAGREKAADSGRQACGPDQGGGCGVILLVDDEAVIRDVVAEALREAGHDVHVAGDGAEAVQTLRRLGRLDLLVTDVGLPGGMNGRQLADHARERRPGLGVVFITGYAESAVLPAEFLHTGMQLVTKPFAIDALVGRIGGILQSDAPPTARSPTTSELPQPSLR